MAVNSVRIVPYLAVRYSCWKSNITLIQVRITWIARWRGP